MGPFRAPVGFVECSSKTQRAPMFGVPLRDPLRIPSRVPLRFLEESFKVPLRFHYDSLKVPSRFFKGSFKGDIGFIV